MRTNSELDAQMMAAAMRAGPFKTKREAVHAGLTLLAKREAYRNLLALRGQLAWSDPAEDIDRPNTRLTIAEPPSEYRVAARPGAGGKARRSRR